MGALDTEQGISKIRRKGVSRETPFLSFPGPDTIMAKNLIEEAQQIFLILELDLNLVLALRRFDANIGLEGLTQCLGN